MWVRGLKHVRLHLAKCLFCVAPYVGAWIETCFVPHNRGTTLSHPMWVRGLKHNVYQVTSRRHPVAPYVGAWIETFALRLP